LLLLEIQNVPKNFYCADRKRERTRYDVCCCFSQSSLCFISFSPLQLYIRKAKGKTKTVMRCTRSWESTNSRPPLSGEGWIEEKGATQKFLLFRTLHTTVYAYGKALFRFFHFPFHGRLRRLSVYSARKREVPGTHYAVLSKREKYFTDQSIFHGRKHEVFRPLSVYSRPEKTREQTLQRHCMFITTIIDKSASAFQKLIIDKIWL